MDIARQPCGKCGHMDWHPDDGGCDACLSCLREQSAAKPCGRQGCGHRRDDHAAKGHGVAPCDWKSPDYSVRLGAGAHCTCYAYM